MKNALKLLTAISLLALVGCEEKSHEEQNFLVGKWNFTERIVNDKDGNELVVYKEDNYYCPLDYYFFKSNGKFETVDYKIGLDFDQLCAGLTYFGTWTQTETTLKIEFEKLPLQNYTIKKISNNEIQLEQKAPKDVSDLFEGKAETQKIIFKK